MSVPVTLHNKAVYDRLAPIYDTGFSDEEFPFYSLEDKWVLSAIDRFTLPCGHSKMAMDLGCATGKFSLHFLNRGYCVTGIDHSEAMLSELDARLDGQKPRFTSLQLDIDSVERLPLNADVVLAVGEVINHLNNWDNFIHAAANSLNPGGILIMTVDNILGVDFLAFALYSHLFRWRHRPSLRECFERVRGSLANRPVLGTWPMYLSGQMYDLELIYRPVRHVKALIESNGLRIICMEGISSLSSLVPSMVKSQVFPLEQARFQSNGGFAQRLMSIEQKAPEFFSRISAVCGIVAIKEQA